MILLTGGTGKIGSEVARLLAESGHDFRALVRDEDEGRRRLGPRVKLVQGDFARPASLTSALKDVETLFLISPNSTLEPPVVAAAKDAGVGRFVKSSALGGGTDPPPGHGAVEQLIESSGVAWTFIRPSSFMQTLASYLPQLIGADGKFSLPSREGRTGWVDVRDIAAVAARVLIETGHEGQAYAVTGPEALSMGDVAATVSDITGRPVEFVPVSPADALVAMESSQLPPGMGEFLVNHYQAVAAGGFDLVTDVVADVGGVEPRTFQAFVEENADRFIP